MSEIKILLRNKTPFDLKFHYDDKIFEVLESCESQAIVPAGKQVWVSASNQEDIQDDLFVDVIENDIAVDCKVDGKQLKLFRGAKSF